MRRLDLGLLQLEVALRVWVDKTTVHRWAARAAFSSLGAIPGVIRLLGYNPNETGSTLGERLRADRKRLGLSHADLAGKLDVDPSTVLDWERGRHRPTRGYSARIDVFLEGDL